ncbi:thioredoxin-disulfide reductase [uncultured Corynebacterium sp.]|uniref:thioredoxin-disulfide reductase n=1 Tax=uncultured Corynebacterium sp. TaxID=159447 RepID=UPI002620E075|nr:thioredoxin-disulfide reductase [uncultured Corynebacterium sp.]
MNGVNLVSANDSQGETVHEDVHDVIIIGSGPAGYTAAVYTARAELKPLVFEGIEAGGLLATTTEVENFPGFPQGIDGPELMEQMRDQAERFGADLRMEYVDSVELSTCPKRVHVGNEVYLAKTIILATGAAPRYLGIEGEERLKGHGVSACATCDGFFFKDKLIAVVGGGDSAMEEATFLTRFGSSVTIIHRRDEFRASAIMLERARANDKIEFITNAQVTEVLGEDKVEALKLTVNGEEKTIPMDAMFLAIGHQPNSGFLNGQVATDAKGYIIVDEPSTKTSIEGVFAAGDLVDSHYQQAVTAAGSGCRAALDAEHYLQALQ